MVAPRSLLSTLPLLSCRPFSSASASSPPLRDPSLLLRRASYIHPSFCSPTAASASHLSPSTDAHVISAVAAARQALPYLSKPPDLSALHAALLTHRCDLASVISHESCKPWQQALAEVDYATSYIPWCSQPSLSRHATYVDVDTPARLAYTTRVPAGVVYAVTPWNFPLALLLRKVVPALRARCAIVAKPSERTPLTALALAELVRRTTDLPDGALAVLPHMDGERCTNAVLGAGVDMVSFTGSTWAGRAVAAAAANASCFNVALELGGNAPFIVTSCADVAAAAHAAVVNKVRSAGQACVAANRFLVHSSVHDDFVSALRARVSALPVTLPSSTCTYTDTNEACLGPLIDDAAIRRVQALLDEAATKGATVYRHANHEAAAVVVGVTDEMAVARDEVFGPVWPVLRFDHLEEAVQRANDTPARLAAYVFATKEKAVRAASAGLRFGMVGVNSGAVSAAATPFGGMGAAGCALEGGMQAVAAYTVPKYVTQGV